MKTETTIKARDALKPYTFTVRVTNVGYATRMLRLGALFMRFGCWLAGFTYEER